MQSELEFWLSETALCLMASDGSACAPAETGGVLLGYWVDDTEVVVTDAIGGGPAAVHLTTGFTPDAAYQEGRIAELYERSGRYHTYLGDWHTHPAGGLRLSRTDRRTARRIAREESARCPRPLMVLLADQSDWRVAAWAVDRDWLGQTVLTPTSVHIYVA